MTCRCLLSCLLFLQQVRGVLCPCSRVAPQWGVLNQSSHLRSYRSHHQASHPVVLTPKYQQILDLLAPSIKVCYTIKQIYSMCKICYRWIFIISVKKDLKWYWNVQYILSVCYALARAKNALCVHYACLHVLSKALLCKFCSKVYEFFFCRKYMKVHLWVWPTNVSSCIF